MKFAEHLLAHITPEWRRQYIVYEDMKTMLYEAVENLPTLETSNLNEIEQLIKAFDEDFLGFCDKELFKINVFYEEKLAEAKRKFDTLRKEMDALTIESQLGQNQLSGLLKSSIGRVLGKGSQTISKQQPESVLKHPLTLNKHIARQSLDNTSSHMAPGIRSRLIPNRKQSGNANSSSLDQAAHHTSSHHINYGTLSTATSSSRKKLNDLKLAFSEFYLSLVLLQNYQRLNFTGFRKILKKHDKLIGNEEGKRWHHSQVETAFFHTNKDVDKLIEDTENIVTFKLEFGDRQRAMKRLRVPPLNDAPQPWTVFRVGFFLGAFLVLAAAVLLTGISRGDKHELLIAFRLYRSPLFIILFIFLVGVNIYGWRAHGVNHVLIFELDPRDHLGSQDLFEIAFSFGLLWCMSVLMFFWSDQLGIQPYLNPLILNAIMLLYLFNPTKTFHYSARSWLIGCIGRIVCAPFFRVRFSDFWLADQLNSLVTVLLDMEYTSCFYLTSSDMHGTEDIGRCMVREPKDFIIRAIVACLPAWWRFAQCVRRYFDEGRRANPHLLNAGKYATVWLVVIFSTLTETHEDSQETWQTINPFKVGWILSLFISSMYTYTWDIKMDWGLFDSKAPPDYKFLREELVYPIKYYYLSIIQDLVLRYTWTLNLSLTEVFELTPDLMTLVLAPAEIIRRFIWNFYRLENEHLNNCGEFRAVRDISISGQNIDLGALNRISRIMDEPDGLSNFRTKVKAQLQAARKKSLANSGTDPSVVLII